MNENEVTKGIIGAAIEVHKALGPGLLESTYEECLAIEMGLRRLKFERQKTLPIDYKGHAVPAHFKLDFIVGNVVVVELKCVEKLSPVHEAQLLTYLRLTGCRVGLLINFFVPVLKSGIKRIVNNFDISGPLGLCGSLPFS